MTTLAKIQSTLQKNYKKYSENNDLSFLENNITLFEQIDRTQLSKDLSRAPDYTLSDYARTLFIVADSFISYAYKNRKDLDQDSVLNYMQQANDCYRLISHHIRKIPPHHLTAQLGDDFTRSEFYKHKIKFQIAQIKLFYLKQQTSSREATLHSLQSLKKIFEAFKFQLQEQYRYPQYRALFQADALVDAVNFDLEEIERLSGEVSRLSKKKGARKSSTKETGSSEKNSFPKKRRRVLEQSEVKQPLDLDEKSLPRSLSSGDRSIQLPSESFSLDLDQQIQTTPSVRQVSQREREAAQSITTLFQTLDKRFREETQQEREISSGRSVHNFPDVEAISSLEVDSLQAPSIAPLDTPLPIFTAPMSIVEQTQSPSAGGNLYSIFSEPTPSRIPDAAITKPPMASSIASPISSFTFWTTPLNPARDSKECMRILSIWESAYFSILDFNRDEEIAAKDKKSLTLEKLGQIMLIAAKGLLENSEEFRAKNINPAIRLAVQLLIKSAEIYQDRLVKPNELPLNFTWENKFHLAIERLSVRYKDLLTPFIDGAYIESEDSLYLLMHQFRSHGSLINIHGCSIEETVNLLFDALSKKLPADDYVKVKKECIFAFEQAARRISAESRDTEQVVYRMSN